MFYKCPNGPACCVRVSLCPAGQDMSTLASVDSSLCWREESILTGNHGAAATPTTLRGWCPSAPSARLWVSLSLFPLKKHVWLVKLTHLISEARFLVWRANWVTYTSCQFAAKNRLVQFDLRRIWTSHINCMIIADSTTFSWWEGFLQPLWTWNLLMTVIHIEEKQVKNILASPCECL